MKPPVPQFLSKLSLVILAGGLALSSLPAAPITALKLSFDNDGPTGADTGNAANPYRAATGDVIVSEIEAINLATGGGVPVVVNSTGPQGGLALSLDASMTGAGYRAVDDVVGNILFRSISYEAVVSVSSGQAGLHSLFYQANAAGTTLAFSSQNLTFNNISVDYSSYFDQWVHIGATVSWDGTTRVTNLYLNNTLVGSTSTSSGAGLLGFGNLYMGYNPSGQQFVGQMDALAVSYSATANDVLGPGTFLLPIPVPEPAGAALFLLGAAGVWFKRSRSRAVLSV